MQVIHELRHGVKLRKTFQISQQKRHIEYELTPFEILLDQIRTRRYNLRKIKRSLAPKIKKDARDIILDFIRSRPPLKPVVAKPKQRTEPLTIHEKLMQSIRSYVVPSLRKASLNSNKRTGYSCLENQLYKTFPETWLIPESLNETRALNKKRLIKVDKSITNSSDDVSSIQNDSSRFGWPYIYFPILISPIKFLDQCNLAGILN